MKRPAAAYAAAALLLATPLCGGWFSCGCAWPWAGFYWTCRELLGAAGGPHCPWCARPWTGAASIAAALAAGGLAAWAGPAKAGAGRRLAAGLLAYALALAGAGLATAAAAGHPTFLGLAL